MDRIFNFHGTMMTIKSLTLEAEGPDLENYFTHVSDLRKGDVSWETESHMVRQYGQVFLENTNHWK